MIQAILVKFKTEKLQDLPKLQRQVYTFFKWWTRNMDLPKNNKATIELENDFDDLLKSKIRIIISEQE